MGSHDLAQIAHLLGIYVLDTFFFLVWNNVD